MENCTVDWPMEQMCVAHSKPEAAEMLMNDQESQKQSASSCGLGKAQVSDEILEALEKAGVSDELFDWWTVLEARAKRQLHGSTPLPRAVRDAAVRHIEKMAQQTGCQWSALFLCVALFDSFCSRCVGGVAIEIVPVVCAAIVGVVKKEDDASVYVHYPELAFQASQFAQWLRGNGYPTAAASVTVKEIQAKEHEVLDVLGWILQIPTIESWARAMMNRLHVLTGNGYAQPIQTMWQTNLVHTMRLVLLKQAESSDLTWGSAACGLFSLSLIGARLLPSAALKIDELDANSWEELLAQGNVPGMKVQSALLPMEESENLLKQLEIATCRDQASIRADCKKVADVMQQAMAEIRSRRNPQPVVRVSV